MYFYTRLTTNEIIDMLEEDVDLANSGHSYNISIIPSVNANDDLTDEDSGDEDNVLLDNLPKLLLDGEAELQICFNKDGYEIYDEFDEEDDIPLASLQPKKKLKFDKTNIKWEKKDLVDTEDNPIINEDSENEDIPSPMELFGKFIDDEYIDLVVNFTNMYAQTKNNISNVTSDEIRCVFGVLLLSGYVTVPRRRMYWETSKDTHNAMITNAISRDRFGFIVRMIHFTNNISLEKSDRFAKIRPLIRMLNKNFQEHAPEIVHHSVDEQMVPYFGRHGCKQYIHGKPIRYGYKFWVGSTYKGYILWVEPYQGAGTFVNNAYKQMGLGPSVILTYADVLSQQRAKLNYHLYFDNLFTTLPLLAELEKRGLGGTGTIRENRLGSSCPLPKKKELKKKPRGWYDYRKTNNSNIIICSWNDSSAVNVASNVHSVEPARSITRWSRKTNENIAVKQPNLINNYNKYMGGVDRADQNISLYRVSIRGKKWYYPIFTHCIDLAEHNAWQLHKSLGGKLDHLSFRRRIATSILNCYGNPVKGPAKGISASSLFDIRYDRMDHLLTEIPRQTDGKIKQLRCRYCHDKTSTKCLKCDVPLHVKCNVVFHTLK